ncbi:MAG: NAD-dependent epimerase/dehydratase family protein [Okeania sp. SIO2D1]|nr:NAD-dependent epimerase/dehydratase family protein [Okeania sp. SIO2D1]
MTKCLVTGGLGFIGHHVVNLLRGRGDEVRILDLATPEKPVEGIEYITGSILDQTLVKRSMCGVDIVFHLAAKAGLWSANKKDFITVNQLGTREVMKAALEGGVSRVVHTSTESILKSYRRRSEANLVNESVKLTLEDMPGPYCQSKFLAEQEAFAAAAQGLPVVIVNPTVPIGPGDINLTPPSRMILGFLNGKYPAFLESTLNLVDARDVAMGHLLAGQKGKVGERYILGNTNLPLGELLAILEELTNLPMPRRTIPYWLALAVSIVQEAIADNFTHKRPSAPLTGVRLARSPMLFDNTKAQQELGLNFRPIRESLRDAIAWYTKQGLLLPARTLLL